MAIVKQSLAAKQSFSASKATTRPSSGGKKTVIARNKVTKQSMKKIAATSPKSRSRNDKTSKVSGMNVPVYSIVGTSSVTLALPKEFFGAKVNKALLTQALRVYISNQKTHPGSTKTRGEIKGSTAKIYRQKGTGRARHGAITAPIFVGGGIVFGPKPREVRLDLPLRMKKAALISALSAKAKDQSVVGVAGLEKISGKTKEVVGLLKKLSVKSALIVTPVKQNNVVLAGINIKGVEVMSSDLVNAYQVLSYDKLLLSKESLERLEARIVGKLKEDK